MPTPRRLTSLYGTNWHAASGAESYTWEDVNRVLLQEIRDELKRLNALLHCQNFQTLPQVVRRIDRRLAQHPAMHAKPGRPRKVT